MKIPHPRFDTEGICVNQLMGKFLGHLQDVNGLGIIGRRNGSGAANKSPVKYFQTVERDG